MSDLNSIPDYVWYRDARMLAAADSDRRDRGPAPHVSRPPVKDPGWVAGLAAALLLLAVVATAVILVVANQGT